MLRNLCCCLAIILVTSAAKVEARQYVTLHEVVRHFQVAFVDRPNLGALLLGGLRGIKKAAPKCRMQIAQRPNLFMIQAGGESLKISSDAIHSYAAMEKALVKAAKLVERHKLAKGHQALEHAIIREMVAHCGDPWSVFLEADLYARLLDDGSKEMWDVGLLVEPHENGLRVLDVVSDMPAAKAGIQVGMRVKSIAGRPTSQINEMEALALLRGRKDSKVKVTVGGKTYQLDRAPEPKRNISVDEPRKGIARIHVMNFRPQTARRLASVVEKLRGMTNLKGLILDLRGNGGGLVEEGRDLVGLFIPGGTVATVVSRGHRHVEEIKSPGLGKYRKLPLVLLVDRRTASTSEIVVLALRDFNRARIVGSKTLGKGTVQVYLELDDGSMLKFSTARYYSPNGTPLHEGIEPDVEVPWDGKGKDIQLERAYNLLRE